MGWLRGFPMVLWSHLFFRVCLAFVLCFPMSGFSEGLSRDCSQFLQISDNVQNVLFISPTYGKNLIKGDIISRSSVFKDLRGIEFKTWPRSDKKIPDYFLVVSNEHNGLLTVRPIDVKHIMKAKKRKRIQLQNPELFKNGSEIHINLQNGKDQPSVTPLARAVLEKRVQDSELRGHSQKTSFEFQSIHKNVDFSVGQIVGRLDGLWMITRAVIAKRTMETAENSLVEMTKITFVKTANGEGLILKGNSLKEVLRPGILNTVIGTMSGSLSIYSKLEKSPDRSLISINEVLRLKKTGLLPILPGQIRLDPELWPLDDSIERTYTYRMDHQGFKAMKGNDKQKDLLLSSEFDLTVLNQRNSKERDHENLKGILEKAKHEGASFIMRIAQEGFPRTRGLALETYVSEIKWLDESSSWNSLEGYISSDEDM